MEIERAELAPLPVRNTTGMRRGCRGPLGAHEPTAGPRAPAACGMHAGLALGRGRGRGRMRSVHVHTGAALPWTMV